MNYVSLNRTIELSNICSGELGQLNISKGTKLHFRIRL